MGSPLQVCMFVYACVLMCVYRVVPVAFEAQKLILFFPSCVVDSSSVPGSRRPVGRQRNTFWPRSRATSTSTLTLQGHWSCRQRHMLIGKRQHSLRWTQRGGFHICCGTTVGRGSMPPVFLHSHLLDWTNQRLLHFLFFLSFT